MKLILQKYGFLIFVSFFVFLILVFFHFKGLTFFDEGYILNSASRVFHGEVIYRDFDIVYTPVSVWITAFSFLIFGESVFAGRILAFVISLLSVFALYKITRLIINNNSITLISMLMFIAWGPAHINFPWPTNFAICFSLYALLFYLYGNFLKNNLFFTFCAAMSVITFLSKQNFGTGIYLTFLIFVLFSKQNERKKRLLYFLTGTAAVAFPFLIYTFATSSFIPFIKDLYIHTIKKIVLEGSVDTPFLYQNNLIEKYAKLVFYLFPLFLSSIAMYCSLRNKGKFLSVGAAVCVIYLFGIRPITDYNHFVLLLGFSALTLAVIYKYSKNILLNKLVLVIGVSIVVLGFYTAYFYGYYKWEVPLVYDTYYASGSRLGIFVTKSKAEETQQLVNYIDNNTGENDQIFVNYYSPLVYFLTNRRNASRYDYLSPSALPISFQSDTVNVLKNKKVKLVMMHEINKNEDSPIANYIKKNYSLSRTIAGFLIYGLK